MSQDYDDLMYEEDPCHQHNHGDDSFARINRGERGDEPMPGETFFKCGGCGNQLVAFTGEVPKGLCVE